MPPTLEQLAFQNDNDYRAHAEIYRQAGGGELVVDPYRSARHAIPLTLSASVLIPAWNAADTLEACLLALAHSSFNCKYPEQLEVIVVDDGSTDGTWELLQSLRINLRLKAIRQRHHSIAHTRNTGISAAEGDVLIACDADMVLAPFALEELIKRHQLVGDAMLLGFRGDTTPDDPRVRPASLAPLLPGVLPPFEQDMRMHYGSMAENMCRDSEHFLAFGCGRQLCMLDGSRWMLPGMVYGALFSLPRALYMAFEGYDERFVGWGCEDTLIGVHTLASGGVIVPVYGAAGLHIAHADRSKRKWQEFAANRHVFNAIIAAPFEPRGGSGWLARAKRRILDYVELAPRGETGPADAALALRALDAASADPHKHGKYLFALGRFDEAADTFAQVTGSDLAAWARFDRGKALRYARRHAEAEADLRDATALLPHSAWPHLELALTLAGQGSFVEARAALDTARRREPNNSALALLTSYPLQQIAERAARFAAQGMHKLALRDYESVLMRDPHQVAAQVMRAKSLAALGDTDAAQDALLSLLERMTIPSQQRTAPRLELAQLQLATGNIGAAKVTLEQVRRSVPDDTEAARLLGEIGHAALRATPLPHGRAIASAAAALPGWYTVEELELLVALALRAAPSDGALLVENGGYCGQALVAIGLTLQATGHTRTRIVSYDDPALGPAPDGRRPRQVLCEAVAAYGLDSFVVLAAHHDAAEPAGRYALALIDGRHDTASVQADIARFGERLCEGGLLVFHDYAAYFPDVQSCVDALLVDPAYRFVAQSDSLIALLRAEPVHAALD